MRPQIFRTQWRTAIAFLFLLTNCAPAQTIVPVPIHVAPTPIEHAFTLPSPAPLVDDETPAVTETFAESTALETATPNLPATAVAVKTPSSQAIFRSPDGKWQVHINVRPCADPPGENELGYDELRVTNLETDVEILADDQLAHCGGLGAYGMLGYKWSDDSRYFYYTDARTGVADGGGNWFRPYSYFDTETGTVIELGGGVASPNDMLFAAWQKDALVIWDWNAGEVARHELEDPARIQGPIAWSADGQSLIFLQTANYYPPGDSYLTMLQGPDFQPTLTEKLSEGDFQSFKWDSPNELRLFKFPTNEEWRFSLGTKELKLAPPDPKDAQDDSK